MGAHCIEWALAIAIMDDVNYNFWTPHLSSVNLTNTLLFSQFLLRFVSLTLRFTYWKYVWCLILCSLIFVPSRHTKPCIYAHKHGHTPIYFILRTQTIKCLAMTQTSHRPIYYIEQLIIFLYARTFTLFVASNVIFIYRICDQWNKETHFAFPFAVF